MDMSLSFGTVSLPTALMAASTIVFLGLERAFPGRCLPLSHGWYGRAILINLCQLAITLAMARVWIQLFGDTSLLDLSAWNMPVLEGLVAWLIATFFFYWWHRLRHAKGWWLVFHQIHHSPARIELVQLLRRDR
jgi:sterol desaturase/sphingolipid hydroxylase (fatty acid hydroxylase superfamily)